MSGASESSTPFARHIEASGSAVVHAPGSVRGDYIAELHQHFHADRRAWGRRGLSAGAAAMVENVLAGLEPPLVLKGLVARSKRSGWVTVTGPAGSGKTAVLSALACPAACADLVPEDFVHALVFLDRTTTATSMAHEVAAQFREHVPGYLAALEGYRSQVGAAWFEQDSLTREVTGPLTHLPADAPIRVVVDGLDQLRGDNGQEIHAALLAAATEDTLSHLRLVVGSRTVQDWMPAQRGALLLPHPEGPVLSRYLQRRHITASAADALSWSCARGDSAWLLARLLADTYNDLAGNDQDTVLALLAEPGDRGPALAMLYERLLDACGAGEPAVWAEQLRPVLAPLAAAGGGPTMPIALLAAASAQFGGPDNNQGVRDVLTRLGRLVVRADPGKDDELVGLFHPTAVEHLAQHSGRRVDVISAHRVLIDQIGKLAPVVGIYMDNPLYRWAAEAEAEHLLELGLITRALRALNRRPLPTPRANLERLVTWHTRVHTARGPNHRDTLTTRANIAYWTGQAGETAKALRLFTKLLLDQVRVLGPDHPDTLATRANIALGTAETGNPAQALHLSTELLPDQVRVLGSDHRHTLVNRANIANWTGETGDPAKALRLHTRLLTDYVRVLGSDHPDALSTVGSIAHWAGVTGDPSKALRLHTKLLSDRVRVLGPNHPDTLTTRANIATWTGETGDPAGALRLHTELLPDRVRVLGPNHPDTLTTRADIAGWTRPRR